LFVADSPEPKRVVVIFDVVRSEVKVIVSACAFMDGAVAL
jgi:hypothetical protein